jgi:predicted ester cyclase
MFWQADGADTIDVLAGVINGPTGLVTRKHINCADKGDFYMLPADGVKFSHQGNN